MRRASVAGPLIAWGWSPLTNKRLLCCNGRDDRFWPVSDLWQGPTGNFPVWPLHLGLLGDLKCIVNVNSKIADGAFELAMTE